MLSITPRWVLDPSDPRSPPMALWDTLTDDERRHIDASLPSEFEAVGEFAPEGDFHAVPVLEARTTLERWFGGPGGTGRTYIASDLPVYYPNERMFSPDLIVVRDVSPHRRERWHVLHEGKGLDFVLEATLHGNREKDLRRNVGRFADLGIPEYFVLDLVTRRLLGYRLGASGRYEALVPQAGRLYSEALGLDLSLEDTSIRFWVRGNPVLSPTESERTLAAALDRLNATLHEAARATEEQTLRAEREEHRAEQERAARLEAEVQLESLRRRLLAAGLDPDTEQ